MTRGRPTPARLELGAVSPNRARVGLDLTTPFEDINTDLLASLGEAMREFDHLAVHLRGPTRDLTDQN